MTTTTRAGPEPLTERQAEVFRWIYETTRDTGIQPGIRDVGARFGIASPHGVAGHLEAMVRKGWIELAGRKSRAVRFLPPSIPSIPRTWLSEVDVELERVNILPPDVLVTSSRDGSGMAQLRAAMVRLLGERSR